MTDYLALLHQFDELGAYDFPSDQSVIVGLPGDVKHLQEALEETLGLQLKLTRVQDAAFYGSLVLVKDTYGGRCPPSSTARVNVPISVRFSNFGRLMTILSCSLPVLELYPVGEIVEHAKKIGFRYVPQDVLELEYSGANSNILHAVNESFKWYHRYFFYT